MSSSATVMDLVAHYVYTGLVPGSRRHALDRCLTAYSKHLARALCALSLLYLSMYVLYPHIYCEASSFKDHDDFVSDMCLNLRYLTVKQNNNKKTFARYDSYTFIFLCLFFQSFVAHLPLLFLNSRFFGHLFKLQKAFNIVNSSLYPIEPSNECVKAERKRKKLWRQSIRELAILQNLLLHWRNGQFVCHYLATRVLALITIIGQFALLEWFLEQPFSQLGIRLMRYWCGLEANNPLSEMSGTASQPQVVDTLCFLYFNFINEYIFSALWFTYSFFAVIFSLQIIFSLLHFTCLWSSSKNFASHVDHMYMSLYEIYFTTYPKAMRVFDLCGDSASRLYYTSFFMLSLTRIDTGRLRQKISVLVHNAKEYCPKIRFNEAAVTSQYSEDSIDMLLDLE